MGLANEDLEEEGEEIFWVTVYFKFFTMSPDHSLIKRNFIISYYMSGSVSGQDEANSCSDWLPERSRCSHLDRSGSPVVSPRKKKKSEAG